MHAEDLRPEEIIRADPDTGFPLFGSQRLLVTGVATLRRFGDDLQTIMGKRKTATILTRLGYDTGLAGAMALADMYTFDNPEEWLKAFRVMLPVTGMAREKDRHYQFDPENKTLIYTGIWEDSFEAMVWTLFSGELSEQPVCHVLSGLVSGYLSAVLGKDVLVHELTCKSQGHEHCTFEARPMEDWGEDPRNLHEPFDTDLLVEEIERLKTELKRSRTSLEKQRLEIALLKNKKDLPATHPQGIIYRSACMAKLVELSEIAAPSNTTILIQGESGTGKELIARFIHQRSKRDEHPFLAINCAAIPDNLIESELFGHVKGAFTDAKTDKKGLLLEAGHGTIFMDEIGELTVEVQAKLLRALQEREVRPVGGLTNYPINARIVTATNQDLKLMVTKGKFRQDLFYRLSVFPLFIMPLRQRREDILILARHFLSQLDEHHPGFTPDAVRRMQTYNWPGNIRELENCVEYAYILSKNSPILPDHLPLSMMAESEDPFSNLAYDFPSPKELVKRYARQVLLHTQGDRAEAARLMGISTTTLWRYLKS